MCGFSPKILTELADFVGVQFNQKNPIRKKKKKKKKKTHMVISPNAWATLMAFGAEVASV